MRPILATALRNRTAALGVALTTASGIMFLLLAGMQVAGLLRSPYAGILVFLVVPALFVAGLLLIPAGIWRERRKGRDQTRPWPMFDLKSPDFRRAFLFILVATLVNVAILSVASYGAVKYSGSQQFCGQACHVMTPQFVAHQGGPHARVECVACHIEPGARGFLRAKLNGTRQLALVASHSYPTPIPSPPTTGIPNVHTSCEQCHWPDRFIGDIIKVVHEYADDEKNTETKTTLRLHVGGPITGTGNGVGIHWHMNRGNRIEYIALDPSLEQIPYVRVSTPDGNEREYFAEGVSESSLAGKARRQMVCIDCHNRPAHQFGSTAERSVDAAIGGGLISTSIPFVRREAVRALKAMYPSQEIARTEIENSMRAALSKPNGSDDLLTQAIAVTQTIYRTNIFPDMKVTWGTYNNQIGHTTTAGCFRCHDDGHKTRDGRVLGQDCESCHSIE